jgi:vang-like
LLSGNPEVLLKLITATEEAFAHIKRMPGDHMKGPSSPLDSYEAAQSIFPSLARPLQKYLRITRQQPRHTMDSILAHLATSIMYDMAPKAFLEKYLVSSPVLQTEHEQLDTQPWSLVCEVLLSRGIEAGTMFQLRQGVVLLLCEVVALPHYSITEQVMNLAHNKLVGEVHHLG